MSAPEQPRPRHVSRRRLVTLAGGVAGGAILTRSTALGQGAASLSSRRCLRSMAELRRLYPPSSFPCVHLLGHTAVGDGGGGHFWFDSSETSNDDDGIVIRPIGIAAGEPGRFVRQASANGSLDVRWFGAQGDGVADDAPALAAALDVAGPRSVVIPAGEYRLSFDLTVAVPLEPRPGALLRPDPGVELTVSGPILAEPESMFLDGIAGGLFEIRSEGTVYANWWSGTDIGESWNRMAGSVNRGAGDASRPQVMAVVGVHQGIATSLDVTGFRGERVFDFTGSLLAFDLPPNVVAVDMTGSQNCTVLNLRVEGTAAVGLLHSRNEDSNPAAPETAGRHVVVNPWIHGNWEVAAYYNIGSEVNRFIGGRMANFSDTGRYAAAWHRENFENVTSVHGVTPGNGTPAPTSATFQDVYGVQFWCDGPTVAGISLGGFGSVALTDCYLNCSASAAAALQIDTTVWGSNDCHIKSFFLHPAGNPSTQAPVALQLLGPSEDLARHVENLFASFRFLHADRALEATDYAKVALGALSYNSGEEVFFGPNTDAKGFDIHVSPRPVDDPGITLGRSYSGTIRMGTLSKLDTTTHGTDISGLVVHAQSGSSHHPLRVASSEAVPDPSPSEGVMWISDGTAPGTNAGDLLATARNESGTLRQVKLVDFDPPALSDLVDGTGGTSDGAVLAVSGSGADGAINDNLADLTTKLNEILQALRIRGVIA